MSLFYIQKSPALQSLREISVSYSPPDQANDLTSPASVGDASLGGFLFEGFEATFPPCVPAQTFVWTRHGSSTALPSV